MESLRIQFDHRSLKKDPNPFRIYRTMLSFSEQRRLLRKIETTKFLKRSGWQTGQMSGAEKFESPEAILGVNDAKSVIKMKKYIGEYLKATQIEQIPALFAEWVQVFESLLDTIRPLPFYKCTW